MKGLHKKVKRQLNKKKLAKNVDIETLRALQKNSIAESAKRFSESDIAFLVKTLTEKDDVLRYNAFLLLQAKSKESPLVYKYWDELSMKLESDNSYQRSIGLMLLSENAQWDKEGKFNAAIDKYLSCCTDEKFITARQAIQGLTNILNATKLYDEKIKQHLTNLPLSKYKENQQKLLKKDVGNALKHCKR